MKSLKLSITFIGLFITSICFGQNNTLPNDGLIIFDKPITVEGNALSIEADKSNVTQNDKTSEAPTPQTISNDLKEEEKIAKNEAEAERLSKLLPKSELTKLNNDYESSNNYPHEDEIQAHIDNGAISQDWLDENSVDKNSKLYKRVTAQKTSK